MVFCTYCGQSFTRDEHLERHILTHTNVKPFKCFSCHMSFARRDLLQRHYTVHGRNENQQEVPSPYGIIPKSAGRTPIACSNCAKTKTKCDKKFPCSRCESKNLKCTLRPTRRSTKGAQRVGMPSDEPVHPSTELPASAMPTTSPYPGSLGEIATSQDVLGRDTTMRDKQTVQQQPTPSISPLVDEVRPPIAHRPSTGSSSSSHHSTIPTPSTPDMALFGHTPTSSYDELRPDTRGTTSEAGPQFMLDWSQMQIPADFGTDAPPDLIMETDIIFDPNDLPMASDDGLILPIDPHSLVSPIAIGPHLNHDQVFLNPSRPESGVVAKGNAPATALGDFSEDLGPIIAARDSWSVFRCTRTVPSVACPKTARLNLELLEQTLRNHEEWSTWSPQWDEADFAKGDYLTVMQLHESTRDKLLAITQSFLHKALEIHRDGNSHGGMTRGLFPLHNSSGSNFVLLPPGRVLEYFLRSYSNSFERFYPLTPRGVLDANELMHCHNERAASLLVLMMVAQGAAEIPSRDARLLAGGLTEACRISLFDLIERNITMCGDPVVLHAALLFTVQAAWSGDKWQMDIAMGQRGMYFAMMRHSGVLESRPVVPDGASLGNNIGQMWNDWIQNESRSRLIYSWIMVDQDMGLMHDTAPLFSVNECTAPMPDADRLWQAKSADEWSTVFEQVHEFSGGISSVGSGVRPLSLRELFRHFLDDEMVSLGIEMTPLQLRLLLHPIQSLVCQYVQLLNCFSDSAMDLGQSHRALTAASTRARLGELQGLLRRWYDLAERYLKVNPTCAVMQTNLVISHLISLNAVTSFPDIERLARREGFDGSYPQLVHLHKRCIHDVEETIYHCGQVLRLIRSMPRAVRPPWWAGAIYRVALMLWTDSLIRKEAAPPAANGMIPVPGPSFAIDMLGPDHTLIIRYLTKREGVPCVSRGDGSQINIDQPFPILQHCIEIIREGAASRFSDGIRSKLDRLSRGSSHVI